MSGEVLKKEKKETMGGFRGMMRGDIYPTARKVLGLEWENAKKGTREGRDVGLGDSCA